MQKSIGFFIVIFLISCTNENKKTKLESGFAEVSDSKIYYETRGKGNPALVFIHGGLGCTNSVWDAQMSHFSDYYKVVAIDLSGHGESEKERKEFTMESFGFDVEAVINKLDLDQVILIGHSMGGVVSLEAARQLNDKVIGIIGVDCLYDFEQKWSQSFIEEWLKPLKSNFVENCKAYARTMFTESADSILVENTISKMASAPSDVTINEVEYWFNYQNDKLIQALKQIKVPITSITNDQVTLTVETNKKYYPDYKGKVMPGVKHLMIIENPEVINPLIQETILEYIKM